MFHAMLPFRIGTRGSALALWQAERVRAMLGQKGVPSELVIIRTSGDEGSNRPESYLDGKGLFTKELEDALLGGRIDLAVHSAKDLGAVLPAELVLGAFPEREDARDALVSRPPKGIDDLPLRARVGTSSLRRAAALIAQRPDVEIVPLRGNVPTRLKRVEDGQVDAAVLALAGLTRLGLSAGAVPLYPTIFVPAPAQGALAIEIRRDNDDIRTAVALLDDPEVRVAVEAERAAMAELEGGCRVPLGITTVKSDRARTLHLRVYAPDGSRFLAGRELLDPADPHGCGVRAARELLRAGAEELMRPPEHSSLPRGRGRG
jgi:hydroxymethylbilane synthase